MVTEQVMPRMSQHKPEMLNEFEERFKKILKRIYRSLQQREIRDEILDERKRIMWQWQCLAEGTSLRQNLNVSTPFQSLTASYCYCFHLQLE